LTTRIGVISSGRGENARYIIEAARSGHIPAEVVIVLADQRDAGALGIARELGVEAHFLDPSGLDRAEYDELLIDHLERAGVDLVVLTGYMRILTPEFVRQIRTGRSISTPPSSQPSGGWTPSSRPSTTASK
jgi:phosphoribosylglycinamide formyltransferase-1